MAIPYTIGTVHTIDIDDEMRGAYIDYAMSVIVARALPDVRDGLKPVHRRILFAMHSMGLRHDRPHRKSARIVGEVLGKFHPHGDTAVYDAMVRMAQDFSMRYPLVDGQGNFGSVDGDNAAAMRYTEARLSEIAETVLLDLEKETVDFGPNFDETMEEPLVMPALLPNLLLNGASGIAVGMATNIPPHNLGEIVDALAYMIDHYHAIDEITLEHLMYFVKGPDFPTGGVLYRYRDGKEGREDIIAKAFASGKGRLIVQAKVHIEAMSRNRSRLVVTELPYQTNNSRVVERIADLVRDGKIEGITDLRDESDRQGMRIVIELTRNVEPKDILEQLYKLTPMRQTFGVNTLALVDGEPRLLSLKRALQLYLEHRREIVRRRSEYDLARAKERAHILEGLLTALANLDDVIATIRRSPDTPTARDRLMSKFKLSEIQAQAILDMPLKRLSRLEREKLEAEYKELKERIKYLEDLLGNPNKMLAVIKDELLELKEKYGDARRTQIVDVEGVALTASEYLPEEDVLVLLTKKGLLFRQSLAGRRRGSLPRRVADAPVAMAAAPEKDSVFLFTAAGQAVQKRIHQIPTDENTHFAAITELRQDDDVVAMLALPASEDQDGDAPEVSLFLYTREGRCKRISVTELWSAAHTSPIVMNVEKGDALAGVVVCDTADDILLLTRLGQAIRFSQDDARVMGLAAAGVLAMKLSEGDQVVGAGICKPDYQLALLTTQGYGLRTPIDQFPMQKRYGSGVIAMKLTRTHGGIETAAVVDDEPEMFTILSKGPMRVMRLDDLPTSNRGARGRQLSSLSDGEVQKILALVIPKVKDEDGATEPPPPPPPPPVETPPPARSRSRTAAKAATAATVTTAAQSISTAPASVEDATSPETPAPKTTRSTRRTTSTKASAAAPETKAAPAKTTGMTRRTSSRSTSTKASATAPETKAAPAKTTSSTKRTSSRTATTTKPSTSSAKSGSSSAAKSSPTSPKATTAQPGSLDAIKKRVRKRKTSDEA
ncbi:MAG: DNA gyrase subunit A [Caldilineales bacterium]|nr:DNA gyrase subunit A [Caldilineales bacterium]